MKKFFALLLCFVLCFTFLVGCGGDSSEPAPTDDGGEAAEPITIKIAHTDSSSRSTNTWAEWLGDYLEENAPGRFNVEVYSDGALGDTTDVIADRVEFLDRGDRSGSSSYSNPEPDMEDSIPGGFNKLTDDDIPF